MDLHKIYLKWGEMRHYLKYIIIFLIGTILSNGAIGSVDLLSPKLFFVDNDHNERTTDWEIKYFPVWRGEPGKRELFLQVWVALPPLLALNTDSNAVARILENSEEKKSPFAKKTEIKKVLTFETQSRLTIFAFNKSQQVLADERNVKIKILFPETFSLIKVTKSCEESDIKLLSETKELAPFLISMDCSGLKLQIKASNDVLLVTSEGKSNADKNEIGLMLKESQVPKGKNVKIAHFQVLKENKNDTYSIYINRLVKKYKKFKSSLEKNNNTSTSEVVIANDLVIVYDSGFYGSKAGMELLFSVNSKLENWNGYILSKVLIPAGYIVGNKKSDSYLDVSISYIKPTSFISGERMSAGGGVRLIHFPVESNGIMNSSLLFAPNFSISLKEIIKFGEDLPMDVNLEYGQILKSLNSEGWSGYRFLGEARFGALENQYGYFSLSLIYGALDIKSGHGHFVDNKVLGGFLFRW